MTTENVTAVYKLQSLDVYFMQYFDPLLEREVVVFYTLADCSPQATEWCQKQIVDKQPNPMSVEYFVEYYRDSCDELLDQEDSFLEQLPQSVEPTNFYQLKSFPETRFVQFADPRTGAHLVQYGNTLVQEQLGTGVFFLNGNTIEIKQNPMSLEFFESNLKKECVEITLEQFNSQPFTTTNYEQQEHTNQD